MKAYFYHAESDTFFIDSIDIDIYHGPDTIYKIGLCRYFTTPEFHHRVIRRNQRINKRYLFSQVRQGFNLIDESKLWVVENKEMKALDKPF